MTTPSRVSSFQLPAPGWITKLEPPSCAMPACIEASVRSDGLKKSSAEDLPGERARLRPALEPRGERQELAHLLRREIARA